MSVKERVRLDAMQRVGRDEITVVEAAGLMGLSLRQARRLRKRFRAQGAAGLVHQLRDRPSNLRSRGYDCRPAMLEVLVRDKVVTPTSPNAWSQADVDAAAAHFEQCEIFTPYADLCQTLGCRYADFLRHLREAAERESAKYGRPVPEDDQYFTMHRQPPRGNTAAIITFTLCDDIRERLERGEEV